MSNAAPLKNIEWGSENDCVYRLLLFLDKLQNQQRLNQVRSPNQPHHGLISPSMKNQLSLEVAPRSRWDVSHNKSYYLYCKFLNARFECNDIVIFIYRMQKYLISKVLPLVSNYFAF